MLSVAKVAAALDVSDKHVYRLIESGQLQAINVSAVAGRKRLRVTSEALSEEDRMSEVGMMHWFLAAPVLILLANVIILGILAIWKRWR